MLRIKINDDNIKEKITLRPDIYHLMYDGSNIARHFILFCIDLFCRLSSFIRLHSVLYSFGVLNRNSDNS